MAKRAKREAKQGAKNAAQQAGSDSGEQRWLLKTEPGDYSWADLARDGGTVWDGVGNHLALIHMRQVRPGDRALVYHTGKERAVVGVARVTSEPYPDPERDDPKRVVFDIEPERRFERPVALQEIKAEPVFEGWDLVRNPRLSVMPVPRGMWERLLRMGGE
jgi:predicted RNA-binding protein with PUA-like domain